MHDDPVPNLHLAPGARLDLVDAERVVAGECTKRVVFAGYLVLPTFGQVLFETGGGRGRGGGDQKGDDEGDRGRDQRFAAGREGRQGRRVGAEVSGRGGSGGEREGSGEGPVVARGMMDR